MQGIRDMGGQSPEAVARHREVRWAYALAVVSVLLWSTNFALGRLLRDTLAPFTLSGVRYTVAALACAALVMRLPRQDRIPRGGWIWLFGMAVTGVFGFGGLLYSGLQRTTNTNASLIYAVSPLVIAALAALFLHERLSRRTLVGVLISSAGIIVIISRGSPEALLHLQFNTGDLLVLAAVAAWGSYSVLSRLATRSCSALVATTFSTWLGLPLLWLASATEWQTHPPILNLPTILALVYIGLFPSVLAIIAWNEGVRRIGPARMGLFYNLQPLFGAVLGALLGEALGLAGAVGGALVVLGSLVSIWSDLRSRQGRRSGAG